MKLLAILSVVAATTLAALAYGRWRGQLSWAGARRAAATTLEYVGLAAGFMALNALLGVLGVLVLRSATGRFVSVYVIDDVLLVVLSSLQALLLGPLLLSRESPRKPE